MEESVGLFVLGTAGCGKSTMVAAMANWLQEGGYPFQIVNLDPGSDTTPYEADVDVRDWMTLADVMEEYDLGPNGAQIVAADMLALYQDRIKSLLDINSGGYIIFDTPGQLELFAFREATKTLVSSLVDNPYLIYLVDPFNARTPSGFISQMMLSSLTKLRFLTPSIDVISKSDMIEPKTMENLERWQNYPDQLMNDVLEEASRSPSMAKEFSIGMNRALEDIGMTPKMFPVSSLKGEGMERIYEVVQLTYGSGDDLDARDQEGQEFPE